jgi:short subunit dehydrogenase-like uncharacterized protein
MSEKRYDIVVFGAASFVGKLLCRYLVTAFGEGELRWAAAGRSAEKLAQLRSSLGVPDERMPTLIADASDENALFEMCSQTRVVISTVGPYALYGEPLVKVCAQSGTDYCDLTGEVQWIRRMLDRYEADAKSSGARIVHCCGFDSIPSDLGVHFVQRRALERFGRYCTHVKMRVRAMRGGFSGGTVASLLNVAREAAADPALRRALGNPYLLCPPEDQPNARQASLSLPQYDADFDAWLAPFIMAAINTRVVFRSNALSHYAYGRDFRYDEAMLMGKGIQGRLRAYSVGGALGGFAAMTAIPPARWFLERFVLPAPGQGPSPASQAQGFYDLRFLGILDDGRAIRAKVTGDADPGYGSTSKMLGQVGALLARGARAGGNPGGFWTPATLLGDQLIEALQQKSGLSFQVLGDGKPALQPTA